VHDRIAITATKKYLTETSTYISRKGPINHTPTQMAKRHSGVYTFAVVVSWALRTGSVAVRSYFKLIFVYGIVIKQD
jgi:hypothetical protein